MTDLQTAPESLFWYWMKERHEIYQRRQRGEPKPWTTDPILRDYKFTNPFRENDRGTVWLRENFLEPHRGSDTAFNNLNDADQSHLLSLVAFNICWYRMFNWTGTGELLGWQTDWDGVKIAAILDEALAQGKQVFTGAHIVYSPPGRPKVHAIVEVCADLYHMCFAASALVTCAREERSLQQVFEALRTIHCVGGFMAYEMVSDMRHTRLLEDATDIMTWANPGPGAKRGLRRLGLPHTPSDVRNDQKAIQSMNGLLTSSGLWPVRGTDLPQDFPMLEMRDIEHSLCEFDKYCRVKFGEGEPRSKFNGRA